MPHQTDWLIENRVIMVYMYGEMTEDDIKDMSQTIQQLFEGGQAPIHCIFDLEGITKPLTDIGVIRSNLAFLKDHRLGWAVGYGKANSFMRFMAGMLSQLLGFRSRMFEARSDALKYVVDMDDSVGTELGRILIEETSL